MWLMSMANNSKELRLTDTGTDAKIEAGIGSTGRSPPENHMMWRLDAKFAHETSEGKPARLSPWPEREHLPRRAV